MLSEIDFNEIKTELSQVFKDSLSDSLGVRAEAVEGENYVSFPMYGGYSFKGDIHGNLYVSCSLKCGFKIMCLILGRQDDFPAADISSEDRRLILESERELANILTGSMSSFFYSKGMNIINSRPLILNFKGRIEEEKNKLLFHYKVGEEIIQLLIIFALS